MNMYAYVYNVSLI